MDTSNIVLWVSVCVRNMNLIQKHPECKKGAAKNLKRPGLKELNSKWAAKAGVVLVLMRIKF